VWQRGVPAAGGTGVPGCGTEDGGAEDGGAGFAMAPLPGAPLAWAADGRGLTASATWAGEPALEHADISATAHTAAASAPKPPASGCRSAGRPDAGPCRSQPRGGQNLGCRRGKSELFIWIPRVAGHGVPVPQVTGCTERPLEERGALPTWGQLPTPGRLTAPLLAAAPPPA